MLSRTRTLSAASDEAGVADVLAAHRLERPAVLDGRDLRGCELAGADLRGASLRGCNLSGMSLVGTNFEGADLEGADLTDSNLKDANLKNARLFNSHLEGADLGSARQLKAAQLCGCDLSYATLPPHIDFYGLQQANQSLGRLAVQFVAMLTVCVYSWLVIGSTTDVNLVTNASSVAVPFIDLSLPILGFYLLVPLALAALSTAFYVHLQTFWDNVATLPAYFPDGCELTARTPPTLLDRLIERHMTLLRRRKATPASRLYAALISVGLFGLVPATLFVFWLRYLPRHDAYGTGLHLVLLLAYLIYAWVLTVSMKAKLRLMPVSALMARSWYQVGFAIATCAILTWISGQALYGPRMDTDFFYAELGGQRISATVGDRESGKANLAGMNLRHANFAGAFAESADFSRSRLEQGLLDGAILRKTFLREADLSRARLGHADLEGADLRRARLEGAVMSNANLRNTNLTQADLRRASLTGASVAHANFSRANLMNGTNAHGIAGESVSFVLAQLQGARLSRATLPKSNFFLSDLRDAYLWRSSLPGASLLLADLAGANLTQADLTGADLSQANLRGAVLDRARLAGAKLVGTQLYDAVLSGADLTGADLHSAELRGAVLRGAHMARAQLGDASLEAADLRGVDLSEVLGLSRAQLVQAVLDETTTLTRELETMKTAIVAESRAAHHP